MIQLTKAGRVFETGDIRTWAVRDVTLSIDQGECVVILGPSGSGKSTLLSMLGLWSLFSEGSYHLGGENVMTMSRRNRADLRNRMIGFVFQSFNLIPDMSVADNIALPLSIAGVAGRERRKRVGELAELVGIGPRLRHRPWQLSGGQQQRVAIARALSMSPQILLCDEPTGNLDSRTGAAMWSLLKKEQNDQGATLILVTHNREFATEGVRALVMVDGRLTSSSDDAAAGLSSVIKPQVEVALEQIA